MTNRRSTLTPRRMLGAVAVALALAVGMAGCSDGNPVQQVRTGRAGPPATDPTVVPTLPSSPTSTAPPATERPVDEVPGSEPPVSPVPPATTVPPATDVPDARRQPHRWEGYTVAADGATLTFTYYAGVEPCSAFDSIVADEGPDSVRVTIYEHSGPAGVACIMLAQLKSATVTLAAPLGGRQLIDGAA
ncbi:MAG: hypothetical protein QOG43_2724 [Actinomycetota bacterium]|jgi:hypothetical protein|nr:hypothetical protein [Actinomycetota bacterium]